MPSPTPTLVNIGTHSLALYAHGPSPTPSQPVVFFINGIATSSLVWAGVLKLLPSTLRSYTYDRSGFSASNPSPLPPTPENIALELSRLMKNTPITNPLILVGHSWAGVLIREFIALTGGSQIAGLVLVDANLETSLQVLNVLDPQLRAVFKGVEHYEGSGIAREHKLTSEEWDAFIKDERSAKFVLQAENESKEYEPGFGTLLKKELAKKQPLLGDAPVFVTGGMRSRDWNGLYAAGVAKGNGTEEQRRYAREMIDGADEKHMGLIREHLKLSTRGKLVWAYESGHFVQLTQPELVVEGVEWVLDELKAGS
ncbi:alpha/beta-Hydrolase [Glarea lozoyensis ATCC 20868]|uniref:Alpha/beta-Hydrolase n=1 Tax=Glarea lozoyensis (strain ATCC 20868 / MF5171) TaxID=1116229 RepID=S3E1T0_GLAL2|nr:alpha/beta-Hydrolase [Glarea lozoyensis ATCC 20868]EPE32438.1 alpha/beta-Hydrolase [Glarea lozoyensis ATCC 20868]